MCYHVQIKASRRAGPDLMESYQMPAIQILLKSDRIVGTLHKYLRNVTVCR